MVRRTEINHRKMLIGGHLLRVENPHGYGEVASTIVEHDVNFRIEVTLKNEKVHMKTGSWWKWDD
jgi:hypothetical protein